jgi:O-antigen/teichoic acid export membrane protein
MKTNTNLILQHILWRGLYFFSVLLINLGIARFFAAEKSGHIFFIVNNLALVLLFVSISLESGTTHFIASGKLEVSQMARFCFLWAIGASAIALVVWYVILYFSHPAYLRDPDFLMASLLFILGVLLTTYFTALFYAIKQFSLPNQILFTVNLVLFIFMVFARNQISFREHFIGLYFLFFFVQGVLLMIFFFARNARKSTGFFPDPEVLKKVIGYSLMALMANGIYFLVNRLDYWFVQHYCSGPDLGNYIQASKLAQLLLVVPAILGATLFPIFSSVPPSTNKSQLAAAMRVLFWINVGCCFIILSFGWYLFPRLLGPSYSKMFLLFAALVPGLLCSSLNYPLSTWFSANKKISVNIRGSMLALLVICFGDIFGLPRYGILTASIVSSAGYFTYFAYMVWIYRKHSTLSWKEFLMIQKADIQRIRLLVRKKISEPPADSSIAQNLIS